MLLMILSRLEEEDRDFVSRLFYQYEKPIMKYARSILGHEMDAEDCVINTFVKVMEYIDKYKNADPEHVRCLLFVTCRNEAITIWRKNKRDRDFVVSASYPDEDEEPDARELADMEEDIQKLAVSHYTESLVAKLLDELDPKYRDIVILKYKENMTNRQIAELLSMSESAVGTRLMRAKQQLLTKGGAELYDLARE